MHHKMSKEEQLLLWEQGLCPVSQVLLSFTCFISVHILLSYHYASVPTTYNLYSITYPFKLPQRRLAGMMASTWETFDCVKMALFDQNARIAGIRAEHTV